LGLDPPAILEAVVSGLHRQAGQTRFGDDLALLLAEYGDEGEDRVPQPMDRPAGQI
jgi:hypothetical protein